MAFGALSSGISALRSFSKGMEVIGSNIANVNTVSYKASRIKYSETFNQVLQQSAPSPSDGTRSNVQASQVGLGVQVEAIVGQFHQGGLAATSQPTDLAISGEGFFLVKEGDATAGKEYATRGGDFRIDDNGYLVTSGGLFVQGLNDGSIGFEVDVNADGDWSFIPNLDSQTGTVLPSNPGRIQLDYNKSEAEVVIGSETRNNAVVYTNDMLARPHGDPEQAAVMGGTPEVDASGNISFPYGWTDGTSTVPHRVGAWTYDDESNPTKITGVTGWNAFMEDEVNRLATLRGNSIESDSGVVTVKQIKEAVSADFFYRMFGSDIDAVNAGADAVASAVASASPAPTTAAGVRSIVTGLKSNADDAIAAAATAIEAALDAAVAAAAAAGGDELGAAQTAVNNAGRIEIDGQAVRKLFFGSDGVPGGAADTLTWDDTIDAGATVDLVMSGFPADMNDAQKVIADVRSDKTPDLSRFSIDPAGTIRYFLDNGESFIRGQIQLVDFNDKTALIREGQNLYSGFGAAGLKTGGMQEAGTAGLGTIQQGALELSNVDITNEFAQMITTQRGFQAGSRIITVSDDILQEVVNLKR